MPSNIGNLQALHSSSLAVLWASLSRSGERADTRFPGTNLCVESTPSKRPEGEINGVDSTDKIPARSKMPRDSKLKLGSVLTSATVTQQPLCIASPQALSAVRTTSK